MTEQDIQSFPEEVANEIKVYVYRLIDPRNGETFYVGKDTRNRVFEHVLEELKADDNEPALKIKRIREIRNAGLRVAHVIHRHGMDDKTAFAVEAALIDAYPGLSNIMGGVGNSEHGVMHAIQIVGRYKAELAEFHGVKALLFSVNNTASDTSAYEAVRYSWRINVSRANEAEVILATCRGLIVGVFTADKWLKANKENFPGREEAHGRWGFVGNEAPLELQKKFIGKRLPERYRNQGSRYTWLPKSKVID